MNYTEGLVAAVMSRRLEEEEAMAAISLLTAIEHEIVCPQKGELLDRQTALLLKNTKTGRMCVVCPDGLPAPVEVLRESGIEVINGAEINWERLDGAAGTTEELL